LRDLEFEISDKATREEVMRSWEHGWTIVFSTLESLKPEDVQRTATIRQKPHTVMQALNRALAHYAQHIEQIVFFAKHLRSSEWKTLSIPREDGRLQARQSQRIQSGHTGSGEVKA
jgi:hypothetical protein